LEKINPLRFYKEQSNMVVNGGRTEGIRILNKIINWKNYNKQRNDPSVPAYSELFSEESLAEYLTRCTPAYAESSNPRRFLIQRELFEKVCNIKISLLYFNISSFNYF
jgi:hypothetical protein